MRVVGIVQARTGSSRLPGKVLLPLAGQPLLQRMLERVCAASALDEVVVATTHDDSDDVLCRIAAVAGVASYRGDPLDLLDRHFRAGQRLRADAVVKIPSDCPLIDPAVINRVVRMFRANESTYDFVSNLHPATFPDGNDVEVIPMSVLETAWHEAHAKYEREHTTPFIWERPSRFRIGNVTMESGEDYSTTHRWTIDYAEDYDFVAAVYEALWTPMRPFSMREVLELLRTRPDVAGANAAYVGRGWYSDRMCGLAAATHIKPTL